MHFQKTVPVLLARCFSLQMLKSATSSYLWRIQMSWHNYDLRKLDVINTLGLFVFSVASICLSRQMKLHEIVSKGCNRSIQHLTTFILSLHQPHGALRDSDWKLILTQKWLYLEGQKNVILDDNFEIFQNLSVSMTSLPWCQDLVKLWESVFYPT